MIVERNSIDMKKIAVIFLTLVMIVAMVASCTDDSNGPIVSGTPPTYGEESTPARPTQSQPESGSSTDGGDNIDLPVDLFG